MKIKYYIPVRSYDDGSAAAPVVKNMGNDTAGLVVYDDRNKALDDFDLDGYDIVECDSALVRSHASAVHAATGKLVKLFYNCEDLVDVDAI